MKRHANNDFRGFLLGLTTSLSILFLFSPPFERNPQQCEMVTPLRRKKQSESDEEYDPML